MPVVELRLSSPVLREALGGAPTTTVTYEQTYRHDDALRVVFWASGSDLAAFETALDDDPTTTDVAGLAEGPARRLYRVRLTEEGLAASTYSAWSHLDVVLLDATGTQDGWDVRMWMPDRESLRAYRDVCEERNLSFQLRAVYGDADATATVEAVLTGDQREALVTAHAMGYFEIPRGALLSDVAARLGVSSQATSERIRRGITRLVAATLLGEAG